MLKVLDAPALRRWCEAGLASLTTARTEIDGLNVYPVPDGDTGTNLMLTMQAVTEALAATELAAADLAQTAAAMARGALLGARGNSGVILSQLLGGFAEVFSACPECTGADLQRALRRAADLGFAAVEHPVEGTVLSVARAAADAAESVESAELAEVARAAAVGAAQALTQTPQQLAVLAAAGVVDAGGRGLVVLLDALADLVTGEELSATASPADVARSSAVRPASAETRSEVPGYEVQYLLTAPGSAIAQLRATLDQLGDSLVVVGSDDLWRVHVHVDDVGATIEAGITAGRPHRISVLHFGDQTDRTNEVGEPVADGRSGRSVVAVLAGDGLRQLFAAEGATIVAGEASDPPSDEEILAAVLATGAAEVVVLPSDEATQATAITAADRARDTDGVQVAVLPTRSALQSLAALAVADADRSFADEVIAMSAAAGSTRWAEVTVAADRAQTSVGVCEPGDLLGLIEGDVAVIRPAAEATVAGTAQDLIDRLLAGGGELVTVVTGIDAAEVLGAELTTYVHRVHPTVEIMVYDGEQPHYPVLLSVE